MSYFGYRFEALCTGHDPAKAIDANDEYVGLFNCKLGDHRLAVAAEIDCVDDAGTYVELKTNKLLASKRLVGTFERFKMFKFWVQSYVVGVPRIVCGFRDEDELRKLQSFDTLELPGLAAAGAQGRPSWRPQACLGFAGIYHKLGDKRPRRYAYDQGCRAFDIIDPFEKEVHAVFQKTGMADEMASPPE